MENEPLERRVERILRNGGYSRKEAEKLLSDTKAAFLAEIKAEKAAATEPHTGSLRTNAAALTSIFH